MVQTSTLSSTNLSKYFIFFLHILAVTTILISANLNIFLIITCNFLWFFPVINCITVYFEANNFPITFNTQEEKASDKKYFCSQNRLHKVKFNPFEI